MKSDPKPSNNQETLESIKEKFSTQLTSILYERLTVDNIENFADDALDKITYLTTEIMEYYYDSNNITPNPDIEFKDQEDDAYTQLGLPRISNILDRIEEKKNEIDKIKDKIKKEYTDIVITPPQENHVGIIPSDGKGIEKKKLLPRLLTLMYILENDLEADLENVKITEGKVYNNMMRQTPYVRVEVKDLERLVYICDEEDNVSYVFDTEKLKEKRITPEDLNIDNKGDKNSLIAMHPGIGVRVVQTKNWRDKVKGYLENKLPDVGTKKNMLGEVEEFDSEKVESEFVRKEKKVYLEYREWVKELKDAYEMTDKSKLGSFNIWYQNEARKHKGWYVQQIDLLEKKFNLPSGTIYKRIGYVKKVETQESYLPYDKWVEELKDTYNKTDKSTIDEFDKWYKDEAKKHKGWYVHNINQLAKKFNVPRTVIYNHIGYVRKLEIQESYLPYSKWVEELKKSYSNTDTSKIGKFADWYIDEARKHKGWYKISLYRLAKKYGVSVDMIYKRIGYVKKK